MSEPSIPTTGEPTGEYREVVDVQETDQLGAHNPNVAAGVGDYDHHNFIGDDADDEGDDEVARAGAELDRQAG